MPEYTPTTKEVRAVWCAFSEYGGLADRPHPGLWDDRIAEFDRWLAARDRENRAIGWDEAWKAAQRLRPCPNPYRGDTNA